MDIKKGLIELRNHVPFTAFAVIFAVIIIMIISLFGLFNLPEGLFHGFHYIHVLVSAIATSAVFYKYKQKYLSAILIGITGAIILGSLSDVLLPYLGAEIFNLTPDFHLPIITNTFFVLFFALLGSMTGIALKKSKVPHAIHVFLSVFASLFYLINYSYNGPVNYFLETIMLFGIVFIAVIIPCCLSDIIYPLLFIKKNKIIK